MTELRERDLDTDAARTTPAPAQGAASVLTTAAHAAEPFAALVGAAVLGMNGVVYLGLFGLIYLLTRPTRPERARLRPRLLQDLTRPCALFLPVMVGCAFLVPPGQGDMLLLPPLVFGLLLGARAARRLLFRVAYRRGAGLEPAVVVGAGLAGVTISRVLQARPEFGLRPVGFVDTVVPENASLPHLGPPERLPAILGEGGIRRIVVAFGGTCEAELVAVLRACDALPYDLHVYAVPRFFELAATPEADTDDLWGFPLVALRGSARHRSTWRAKRAFDMLLAGAILLLTSPLFLAVAVAVKLSSPGPVLFRQQRVGQFGRLFDILKFRTMRQHGDGDTQWSADAEDDDRITTVGRFLRPTHLDELPQLLNVLRGEMSLVGPRPERPVFVDRFSTHIPGYEHRHRVPVGITGWAQVHGFWGDTSISHRARFDNRYIENWSLSRDLTIILRTIPSMFGRANTDEFSEATRS